MEDRVWIPSEKLTVGFVFDSQNRNTATTLYQGLQTDPSGNGRLKQIFMRGQIYFRVA